MIGSDIVGIELRGGTVLRIRHAPGVIHNTYFAYLLRRDMHEGSVFEGFTAETIRAAELVDGTVAWRTGRAD